MRRFISTVMILCLLQVTTFAAIPVDSTPTHPLPEIQHTSVSTAQSATAYIAISADDANTAHHVATQVSSLTERLTSTANQLYSWAKAKAQSKSAPAIIVPSFFVAGTHYIYVTVKGSTPFRAKPFFFLDFQIDGALKLFFSLYFL